MGTTLLVIGAILNFSGRIWIACVALSEGETMWGVLSFLVPFVAVIYGIMNFHQCKVQVGIIGVGIALIFAGFGLGA